MPSAERRPRYRRPCPVPGCDWWQVTAWYVGGPDHTEEVSEWHLRLEAEAHLLHAHYRPGVQYFT